jgi:heme-degrading monooxygenase HmoA
MIVRMWRGETALDKEDSYAEYLQTTGVTDYRATPGNRGVLVLRRRVGDRLEWLTVSLWESVQAIEKFAGTDIEKARYYTEDADYLLTLEPNVRHYEVVLETNLAPERMG